MANTIAGLDVARRIYKEVVTDTAGAADTSWQYCLNMPSTTQEFEIYKLVDEFGYLQPTLEGADYSTEDRVELYEASFYPVKYTGGYGWTEEADYTDQYDKLKENARLIQEALDDTMAKDASDMFNNGFDTTNFAGIDTVSLFHTAHPTNGGITWSNRPATDIALNATNFGQAIQEMAQTKQSKNRPVKIGDAGVVLRVPPSLWMAAKTIEDTVKGRPGTANNDANVMKEFLSSVYMDQFLTSTTAWFLTAADKSKLGLFMLNGLPTANKEDLTNPAVAMFYTRKGWVRGWKHARRTWGTTGS